MTQSGSTLGGASGPSIKQHAGWVTRGGLCDVPRKGSSSPKQPHLVATCHWPQVARWNLSFRYKPLKPDDFPVEVEGEELVTVDGKPIAKAKTPAIAEDIADRLNEDDCRKEEDRWSA